MSVEENDDETCFKRARTVAENMVKKQTVDVDVVSGATYSSKGIIGAVKEALKEGYECYVFFVIQMSGVRYFTPNMDTHPEFKEALKEAAEAGVHVVAYDCSVREDEIRIQDPVPVILENP